MKKVRTKKYKLKKRIIVFLGFFILFVISVYKISSFYLDAHKNKEETQKIIEEVITQEYIEDDVGNTQEVFKIDFDSLKAQNPSVKGWIYTYGGEISYPIVQYSDNEYYLSHSFTNKSNSLGAIFMDYRNKSWNDRNVVIFGHNAGDKSMFGKFRYIFDKEYFEDEDNKQIIIYDTDNQKHIYEIFSYYAINAEEYYITTDFSSDLEYLNFLNTIKGRSFKNFGIRLNVNDKILTISTCNGNSELNRRTVIHAKLINE